MLAQMATGEFLEGGMLVCFGVSWPVSILKTLRTRRTEGKSLGFLVLVFVGYLCGIAAKVSRGFATNGCPESVTVLYALNAVFVATDIVLYLRFRGRCST